MILQNMIHYSEIVVVHNECTIMYNFIQTMGAREMHPITNSVEYFDGLGNIF
jgi:hypothetical protein